MIIKTCDHTSKTYEVFGLHERTGVKIVAFAKDAVVLIKGKILLKIS